MNMLKIENNGPKITSTNYWQSSYAEAGAFYLSLNAGAFRLLVPESQAAAIEDMRTAKKIIISIGPWPEQGRDQAIEILFDDQTDSPFALHFGIQQIDRIPPATESGRSATFIVYQSVQGAPQQALNAPCYFRYVDRIPCLKPWKGSA